jgi:hypothetical protein
MEVKMYIYFFFFNFFLYCNRAFQECFLTSARIQDKKKLCELACQLKGRPETCTSTSALVAALNGSVFESNDIRTNEIGGGSVVSPDLLAVFSRKALLDKDPSYRLRAIHLMPGSACDNYQVSCCGF